MRYSPLVFFCIWLSSTLSFGQTVTGRFVPPDGKVVVFAGGGNAAVGGTQKYRDGYVDNINVPGGISHAIRFSVDPNTNSLTGLTDSVDWGTGPIHLKAFLDSPILDRCAIHLSIAILAEDLPKIASGNRDWLITQLVNFIGSHSDHPFYLEIGPEFDDPANKYDPKQFRAAYQRIVDAHRLKKIANVAFVLGSSNAPRVGDFEKFDPGKDYIDWVGYSWNESGDGQAAIDFAAKIGRPAMITRATPFGRQFGEDDSEAVWQNWFDPFFKHIEVNKSYLRAISYNNVDFEAYELSKGWGNVRIDADADLLQKWREKMNLPQFLNSVDKPFESIAFPAPFNEVVKESGERPRYKDPEFTTTQRVDDLLNRMTLEEKCAQLSGWRGSNEQRLRNQQGIYTSEFYKKIAPHGIGVIAPLFLSTEEDLRQYYAIQTYFLEETRLGIPALRYSDVSHGLVRSEATSFPSPIALSTSWNMDLVAKVYEHIAKEALSRGVHFLVTPDISPVTDLRSGHIDNTFGESSFLAARFGEVVVGSFNSSNLASIAKFNGNDDFKSLQQVVRNMGPSALQLDSKSKQKFTKHMAFDGIWSSPGEPVGDQIHLYLNDFYNPIELVKEGKLSVKAIDQAVREVLRLKFDLGLFERPLLDIELAEQLNSGEPADQLALEAARQSLVLLKNDNSLLPLDRSSIKSVAVIGPNADVCRLGTHSGTPRKAWSLLDGLSELVGDSITINHSKGCLISINDTNDSYQNWKYVNTINLTGVEQNMTLIEKAVSVAHESDVVILALGEAEFLAKGFKGGIQPDSYKPLELTEAQQRLAKSVLQTGKPVILYLSHSAPVCLGDIGDECRAILTGHYNGQKTGVAAAEVIFGEINPAGKLTIQWPVNPEGGEVQYPFGHGLSFTEFSYGKPELSSSTLSSGESVKATVKVANTGKRKGAEVVQLYVKHPDQKKRLVGFRRVNLLPGQNLKVAFQIPAVEFFNDQQQAINGEYEVQVGESSAVLSEPEVLTVNIDGLLADQPNGGKEAEGGFGDLPTLLAGAPEPIVLPMPKPLDDDQLVLNSKQKPNVLFIAVDDMRPELGFNGTRLITPNIDQLAKRGISFEKAYCQQSSSDFSRLSVMTGLYPGLLRANIQKTTGWRENLKEVITMNQYFRQHGYQTIGIGNVYSESAGADADLGNWNQWVDLNAPIYQDEESLRVIQGQNTNRFPAVESANVEDDSYIDGKRARRVVALLEQLGQSPVEEPPFFLSVGFSRPKMPFTAPEQYWSAYQRSQFRTVANKGLPQGFPDYVTTRSNQFLQQFADFNGSSSSAKDELEEKLLHGYAASVSYVDSCIGELIRELNNSDLIDNTIIVLWGDNGVKLGDHSGWGGGSNLECDTRVPLIVCDPRNTENAGLSTDSIVELIDLFPSLCEMVGIKPPAQCQGISFAELINDMGVQHRTEAFSSYPTESGGVSYSLRYQQYRFSQWFDQLGQQTHTVLTDISADPGEQTNVLSNSNYQQVATQLAFRLSKRIDAAYTVPAGYETILKAPKRKTTVDEFAPVELTLDLSSENRRQKIDGFGGSIAFLGTKADDAALEAAIFGLNLQYLRVRGEVPVVGPVDHNRELLARAVRINPNLQIMLSFWQPRSAQNREWSYWMEERVIDGVKRNVIRSDREEEWAYEIINRIRTFINWGINVTAVSVQNEPNQSIAGTQSCYWEPEQLATFIEEKFKPKMNAAGLGTVKIVSPELSSIGDQGIHFDRYIPALTTPAVDIASFHMNGGYQSGQSEYTLQPLQRNVGTMVNLKRLHFPDKKLWMTETSGAHWLSAKYHTYGWKPQMTEHEKAIKAARYIHTALDAGEVNAFFWWGLIYSLPTVDDNQETTYQHRDEGLILVDGEDAQGVQTLIEKSKKFFTFRQYSAFVKPGYQRIEVNDPDRLPTSVYLSPNERIAVAVAINDTASAQRLVFNAPEGMKLLGAFQTDEERGCEPISPQVELPSQSVRTLIFSK